MSDREVQLATFMAIAELFQAVTGRALVIEVPTSDGYIPIRQEDRMGLSDLPAGREEAPPMPTVARPSLCGLAPEAA